MLASNQSKTKAASNAMTSGASDLFATLWKPITMAGAVAGASPAHAAAAGAPWEAPLQTFLNSLTGPVAQIVGVAAIVLCGFAIAFSEGGGGIRKLVWVALGLSIAYSATAFFLPLFGFAGGVAF
jgi:type IV secretory pathway VirB2 component (pilin)